MSSGAALAEEALYIKEIVLQALKATDMNPEGAAKLLGLPDGFTASVTLRSTPEGLPSPDKGLTPVARCHSLIAAALDKCGNDTLLAAAELGLPTGFRAYCVRQDPTRFRFTTPVPYSKRVESLSKLQGEIGELPDLLKECLPGAVAVAKGQVLTPDVEFSQLKDARFKSADGKVMHSLQALVENIGFLPEGVTKLGSEVRAILPAKNAPKLPPRPPPPMPPDKPPEKPVPKQGMPLRPEKLNKESEKTSGVIDEALEPVKKKRGRPRKDEPPRKPVDGEPPRKPVDGEPPRKRGRPPKIRVEEVAQKDQEQATDPEAARKARKAARRKEREREQAEAKKAAGEKAEAEKAEAKKAKKEAGAKKAAAPPEDTKKKRKKSKPEAASSSSSSSKSSSSSSRKEKSSSESSSDDSKSENDETSLLALAPASLQKKAAAATSSSSASTVQPSGPAAEEAAAEAPASGRLKSGWVEQWSDEYGLPFWWNEETEESVWEAPLVE